MSSQSLNVLLVGNGGREHVLAWALSKSNLVKEIHVVPGNGGTAGVAKCKNVAGVCAEDFVALIDYAKQNEIDLLVPGPEAPLVAGITDVFKTQAPHIRVFGPSLAAAKLEGSKTWSKDLMKRYGIPTAGYENFTNYEAAAQHIDKIDYTFVIKADGLAAGKGVIIPKSKEEAHKALKDMMLNKEFGEAGNSVVIEEFLEGDEISILSLSDGEHILSLPPAQDHKRIYDNDQGPNTGGMGTYAPAPVATPEVLEKIERTVLKPTIEGMKKDGMPFVGCLFTGFMVKDGVPKVLEYNVRFGDPESQSCLPLLKSDLAELMLACTDGTLASKKLEVIDESACTVVLAAGGYPGSYKKGTPMQLAEAKESEGKFVFHAGTALKEGQLVTSGGRVIASTATGKTLREAVDKAYEGVQGIQFEGRQYRKDIAARALR